MSVAPLDLSPPQATYTNEAIFRLTVEQYHQLIESGTLGEDNPVELLEGVLVCKMPKNTPLATSTKLCAREIARRLPSGWNYQSQEPVTLSDGEPEPDGAIVRGTIEDYVDIHPQSADVALIIEVSDRSLERDRGIKLRSYARAGIGAYWIINLKSREIEVHTNPVQDDPTPSYKTRSVFGSGSNLTIDLTSETAFHVPVDALLPPI